MVKYGSIERQYMTGGVGMDSSNINHSNHIGLAYHAKPLSKLQGIQIEKIVKGRTRKPVSLFYSSLFGWELVYKSYSIYQII